MLPMKQLTPGTFTTSTRSVCRKEMKLSTPSREGNWMRNPLSHPGPSAGSLLRISDIGVGSFPIAERRRGVYLIADVSGLTPAQVEMVAEAVKEVLVSAMS